MTKGLFEYILKYSKPQQIVLISVTCVALPFYYLSLDLPKIIVNEAIGGNLFPIDLRVALGPLAVDLGRVEQIPYLTILCFVFLMLVLINGGFKYFINVYRGVLGERMLRRIRYQLIERIMRFPISHFRHTSQGELVSMVNQETEPLAGFIGESVSLPLYQGGIMVTILIFMFVQDWILGLAAIALYPLQSWLIPKLQKQVNLLNRERTQHVRSLAEKLGETVAGIHELHSNDSTAYMKSMFSERLGRIFDIRVSAYRKKFFIKFLNNFIAQITPFFFFLIGGYLVINGELSFGALVAVLAAYKDLSAPWKELLNWYQRQADARMKYQLLTEQFAPEGMLPETLQPTAVLDGQADLPLPARAPISAVNVGWADSDGTKEVDLVSLSLEPGAKVALVGVGNSGKDTLAHMLARLVRPTSGRITVAEADAGSLPEPLIGRTIGYLGPESYLFSDTVLENLLLGLKHQPKATAKTPDGEGASSKHRLEEARRSGNSEVSPFVDWIDYGAIGVDTPEALRLAIFDVLRVVDLSDDLIQFALRRTVDVNAHPDLVEKLLLARRRFRERLAEERLQTTVEPLDSVAFNSNTTIAENLLFGTPIGEEFDAANLAAHPHVQEVLRELELTEVFDDAAHRIAALLVELLADLPPGHEFFERFSFVDPDELSILRVVVANLEVEGKINKLAPREQQLVRSLPFKVTVGRHRLGLFDDEVQNRIVQARRVLMERLPEASTDSIEFFDEQRFNAASSVEDNIMFGRIAYGRLGAPERARALMTDVLDELQVLPTLLDVALQSSVGIAGARLPVAQRQKLALGRVLLKQPRALIVNEGLSALDTESTGHIFDNIITTYPDISLLWMDNQLQFEERFDHAIYLEGGKVVRTRDLRQERADSQGSLELADERAIRSAATLKEDEKVAMLRSVPMFRHLDPPTLKLLSQACEPLDYAAGQELVKQGDVGDALYVIVDGEAAVMLENDGGARRRVGVRGTHEVIGEVALLTQERRTATIEALTDLATLRLSKEVFVDMLQSNGELGYQILQLLATRLAETSSQLEQSLTEQQAKAA